LPGYRWCFADQLWVGFRRRLLRHHARHLHGYRHRQRPGWKSDAKSHPDRAVARLCWCTLGARLCAPRAAGSKPPSNRGKTSSTCCILRRFRVLELPLLRFTRC
jgi:hypothetical protein